MINKVNHCPTLFNTTFIILLILFAQVSFSSPEFPLTDNGALIWTTNGIHVHGGFPVNGGDRLFAPFSVTDAYTGVRHIYLQIFGEDGAPEYENPVMLSREDNLSDMGGSAIDGEGNIFIAWVDADIENPNNTRLYALKYNSDGQSEWGEDPIQVGELFFGHLSGYRSPAVLPDDNGGFYFLTGDQFPAIDGDGSFRQGWPWQNSRPDELMAIRSGQQNSWHIYEDGAGGFWYETWLPDRMHNKVNYDGQVLWEEAQFIRGDRTEFMHGFRGGGLFNVITAETDSLVILNENGELWSEDHIHSFSEVEGRGLKTHHGKLIDDIFVLVLSGHMPQDPDRIIHSNITFYDPIENTFPAGLEGIDVGRGLIHAMTQTSDGNVLYTRSRDRFDTIEKLTLNGERVVQDIQLEDIRMTNLISAPENGFWAFGVTSLVGGTDYKLLVNRYTENGAPFSDNYSSGNVSVRYDPVDPLVWMNDEMYNMTFWQAYAGLTLQTLDAEGEIAGDPDGDILREDFDRIRFDKRYLSSIKIGDRVIVMRGFPYFVDDIRSWNVWFYGFDLAGEELWQSQLADSSYKLVTSNLFFDLYRNPDDRHIYWFYQHNDYRQEDLYLRIASIDAFNGEIVWERELDNSGDHRFGSFQPKLVIGEDYIYIVSHSLNNFGLEVYKMDFDGNLMWEQPFYLGFNPDYTGFIGFGLKSDGALWMGRFEMSENGAEFYLDVLTPDQQYHVDEEGVYSESLYLGHDQSDVRTYAVDSRMISTTENAWILPYGQTQAGIQCLSSDGERLLGDHGYGMGGFPEERTEENLKFCEDKAGGVWVVWNGWEGIKCQHFGENGLPRAGWGRNGVQIWQDTGVYELLNLFPHTDENLLILADQSTFVGEFREWTTNSTNYGILHVCESDVESTPADDDLTPGCFEITALYPNPFNNRINIEYELPGINSINLQVSDNSGRSVFSGLISPDKPGNNILTINANDWGSGIYIISCRNERVFNTKKVVLLK